MEKRQSRHKRHDDDSHGLSSATNCEWSCRRAQVAFVPQRTELTKTTISVESCASGSCPKLPTRRSPKTGSMSAAHAGTSHFLICPVGGSTGRAFDSIPGTAQRKPGADLGVAMPMEGS